MTDLLKFARKNHEQLIYHEHDNGLKYFRHDYFELHDDLQHCPQSYLIQQLPNITNPLHFHTQNQFQVFIEGSGHFGRHSIRPYVVHYAGAYTGYGPIVAGPEGVQYLTLRASRDLGAQFLPVKMESLKKGPKHHYTSPPIPANALRELGALNQVDLTWIHQENTLGIGVLKMPTDSDYFLGMPSQIAGIFIIVMQGAIAIETTILQKNENLYIHPDHPGVKISTHGLPAQMLVLQMPLRDEAYQAA